jgi:hypothetical protein
LDTSTIGRCQHHLARIQTRHSHEFGSCNIKVSKRKEEYSVGRQSRHTGRKGCTIARFDNQRKSRTNARPPKGSHHPDGYRTGRAGPLNRSLFVHLQKQGISVIILSIRKCVTVTSSPLQSNSKGHGNSNSPSIAKIQNTTNIGLFLSVGDPEQELASFM